MGGETAAPRGSFLERDELRAQTRLNTACIPVVLVLPFWSFFYENTHKKRFVSTKHAKPVNHHEHQKNTISIKASRATNPQTPPKKSTHLHPLINIREGSDVHMAPVPLRAKPNLVEPRNQARERGREHGGYITSGSRALADVLGAGEPTTTAAMHGETPHSPLDYTTSARNRDKTKSRVRAGAQARGLCAHPAHWNRAERFLGTHENIVAEQKEEVRSGPAQEIVLRRFSGGWSNHAPVYTPRAEQRSGSPSVTGRSRATRNILHFESRSELSPPSPGCGAAQV